MNHLFEAANEVCEFLTGKNWDYCIIGGLALQKWGEPRTTLDTDIALYTGLGEEESFVDPILERFQSRISEARVFALKHRVLLIQASNKKDIDIVLSALPFEREMIRRARRVEFAPSVRLPCCTAEDLVIMKVFANRPRDQLDAEGIVDRQHQLDTEYILRQLAELCEIKEAPEILEKGKELLFQRP